MKPRTIAFSSLLTLLTAAQLVPPVEAAEPAAVIENPVVDVGVVAKGESIEQVFTVSNSGDGVLEILDVQSACGCAIAEFDRTIAPGGSGEVRAVVTTESLDGPVAKSVTLYTNDPTNPRLDLVVKANIRVHVDATPSYARFIQVLGEESQTVTMVLSSGSYRNLKVSRIESPYPFLDVRYREAEPQERLVERDGRQWAIVVSLPSDAPVGPLADYLRVHTNHPQQKVLQLPVHGFVQPALSVTPSVADVGRQNLAKPYTVTFEIKNQGTPEISVDQVTTTVSGARTKIEMKEDGRLYKVLVTLPTSMPKGEFSDVVRIRTSSATQPELEIDLRGTVL